MRIVAYCRVSTDKEEQKESLENQKEYFEEFAKKYGHTLVNVYPDEGISGKQIKNRAQFLKMLDDAKQHLFDMVVVKDISRFARNTVDLLNATRQLKADNIEVQFVTSNQTILGNSEFILTIFGALAQEESASLSKRVKFGKKINAQKGRVPNFIFGYDRIDNFTMQINEVEVKIIRRIFSMYVEEGYGSRKIALIFRDERVPCKDGTIRSWTPKAIRRILINETYAGVLINNKSETIDFLNGIKSPISNDKWMKHIRPELAIISQEIFDKTQLVMLERRKLYENKNPGGRQSNRYALSTLIKCEHCGYSYSRKVYKYKNTYIRWKCTGNDQFTSKFCPNNAVINEDEILLRIRQDLTYIRDNRKKYMEQLIEEYYKQQESKQDIKEKEKQIIKDIAQINKLKEKYANMYTEDIIGIAELKSKSQEFDSQKNKLSNELKNIQYILGDQKGLKELVDSIMLNINMLLEKHTWTNSELKSVVDVITVNQNGGTDINYKGISKLKV